MTKRKAEAALLDQEEPRCQVFAEPTYDQTFKMLFCQKQEKLLKHFLNHLLDFQDNKLIVSLKVIDPAVNNDDTEGVKSTVDVRCTTKEGKEIAVEMQRSYKQYFLPRTQEYMAKIVAGQVRKGESALYHLKMKDTYVLVIAKEDLFIRDYSLEQLIGTTDKEYEKTVVPYIVKLNQEIPGNKMHWKFFELQRFARQRDNISEEEIIKSPKLQWLDFFNNCGMMEKIPSNIDPIIKEAYKTMEMANWTPEQREKYWALKSLEVSEAEERKKEKQEHEQEVEEAKQKSKQEGKIEGRKEGEQKGKLKGEISQIKTLIELEIPEDKIIPKLKFLTDSRVSDRLADNLSYIKEHMDETESVICDELGLCEALLPASNELEG